MAAPGDLNDDVGRCTHSSNGGRSGHVINSVLNLKASSSDLVMSIAVNWQLKTGFCDSSFRATEVTYARSIL